MWRQQKLDMLTGFRTGTNVKVLMFSKLNKFEYGELSVEKKEIKGHR